MLRSQPSRRPATLSRCLALCSFFFTSLAWGQTDGAQKWASSLAAFSSEPGNVVSSPSVAPDGTIYIGTEVGTATTAGSGRLFAINPDGSVKWKFTQAADWIDSAPIVATDGTIYFGCWDGNLYALNADGSLKWKFALTSYASGSPALGADGTIYIGTGAGDVYAVNPNGTQKWVFPTLYWIEGAPAVGPDGTIYVGSDDNNVYAIRPDGTEKWHYGTGNDVASSPAIGADGTIYVGSRDLKLYALKSDGTLKWSYQTTDMIDASPVLGADGTVYFATTGGQVFALRQDGTLKWQYPAAGQTPLGSIYSTPAVRADGSIVFGSSDNAVYALKSDGTLLWKSAVGDWTDSSPCVAPDGTIYIGCTDKNLYAFTGKQPLTMTDWPQFLRNPQRTGYQPLGTVSGTTGRLVNLAVRTLALTGDQALIGGFYVGGSGSRTLLVRGVGPTLTNYGLTGVLNDPQIAFYPSNSSTPTLTNNNWNNDPTVTSTGNAVGAFPLQASSLDAAFVSNFAAGGGSVQVSGADGGTGLALVEVYDAGGSSTARLTNLAARSFVGTGTGVLIGGFVVSGSTRAVLVRGVGPGLSQYLADALPAAHLQVFSTVNGKQTLVAENTGWSNATNAATIDTTGSSVGAFKLQSGSQDSAMLLVLPPGLYSAEVSGVNNATGVGLVEVYEIP